MKSTLDSWEFLVTKEPVRHRDKLSITVELPLNHERVSVDLIDKEDPQIFVFSDKMQVRINQIDDSIPGKRANIARRSKKEENLWCLGFQPEDLI